MTQRGKIRIGHLLIESSAFDNLTCFDLGFFNRQRDYSIILCLLSFGHHTISIVLSIINYELFLEGLLLILFKNLVKNKTKRYFKIEKQT